MSGLLRSLAAALLLLALGAPAAAAAEDFIVVFEPGVERVGAETQARERARGFEARLRFRHAVKGFSARLSAEQADALREDPEVAAVVRDRRVRARAFVPLAPGEPQPPLGVRRIEAATATTARQASTAGVAVLDSGVDLDHPDLNVADGVNCVTPGAPADDDNGHGTHVAGTIAAENDGAGVVGVAPGTRIHAVKVLDAAGSGSWSQIVCGLDWVTANAARLGIRVANLSLGGPSDGRTTCSTASDPLHGAICGAALAGVLSVVATGNETLDIGSTPVDVPSTYPEVLAVTAMTDTDALPGAAGRAPSCTTSERDDSRAAFSNYATRAQDLSHTLAAPGVCVRSTTPGGRYETMSGTSMAAPHVAGAAALCLGEAGAPGPCAGLTTAGVLGGLMSLAKSRYEAGPYGFLGDPLSPLSSGWGYGRLVHVPAPTTAAPAGDAPADAETSAPAPAPAETAPTETAPAEAEAPAPAPEAPAADTASPAAATPPAADTTPPAATLRVPRQRARRVRRRGLVVWVGCSERCSVVAGRARASMASDAERRLVLRFSRRALKRRWLVVEVRVSDGAGNSRVVRRRVRLAR